MPRQVKALVITVNFRGCAATLRFLRAIAEADAFEQVDVIVVENASQDGSGETIREAISTLPNVSLLESDRNRGYFGAARWALEHYLSAHALPDWTIVCNNDIMFERDFFAQLFSRDPREAGVRAPAIIPELTGIDCNPFYRQRPTRWQVVRFQFWLSNYWLMATKQLLAPAFRKMRHRFYFWRQRKPPTGVARIYAPHGACIIFSRRYFEAGGYIDDGFFLYAEEFSVAEIARRRGIPVVHDTALLVRHNAHHSTGRLLTRDMFRRQQEGLRYLLENYWNAPAASHSTAARQG